MCNVLCRRILLDLNRADDSYVLEYALKGGRKGIRAVVVLVNRKVMCKPVPLSLPFFSLSLIIIY